MASTSRQPARAFSYRAATFSPDGHSILTGGNAGTVRVWDRVSARAARQVRASDAALSVAFSLDSRHILAGDKGGTAWRWSTAIADTLAAVCAQAPHDLTAEERALRPGRGAKLCASAAPGRVLIGPVRRGAARAPGRALATSLVYEARRSTAAKGRPR